MKWLEYPYVIITVLASIFLVMGVMALYFTVKSLNTAKSGSAKSFCGLGKIESVFEKAKLRSLLYITVDLDGMKRLYSESRAHRMYEQLGRLLFCTFCADGTGEISLYGTASFVVYAACGAEEVERLVAQATASITEVLEKHSAVNVADVRFGSVCTSATDLPFKTALARAKQACSMAKDQGVSHCRWDNTSGKAFDQKVKIENNIRTEIKENRFFLEYQPILDAKSGKVVGAEVLSRLNSPTEGVLSPYHFLSAVNNVGLNREFDYYIFEKNCKWIASDPERRAGYVYTTNFSRATLCDEALSETVLGILEKYGIAPSCIAVEILEDKDLADAERAAMIQNLSALKEKGVLIFLDDFGSGYTGFGDLADFDISIVKIDKAVTQGATTETGLTILRSIITTAHELGFRTLCEGIETEEHKNIAVECGCDMLQGYYLYTPMPVAQLEKLLEQK